MYAVDDLGDAAEATREFLTPVRAWTWIKLAVVVFFVGGVGGGFPSFPSGGGGTGTPTEPGGEPTPGAEPGTGLPALDGEAIAVILVVAAGVLAVVLLFTLIASIMEFVLVESLRTEEVYVLRYAGRNVGKGLRLLAFRIGLGALSLAVVGLPILALYLSAPGFEAFTFAIVVALVAFAIATFVVFGVVQGLTTNFVVPVMLLEERGVLSAWRRFWPTLRGEWKEYVVYYVLAWILQLAVGFGFLIVSLVVGIPIFIALLLLFFVPVVGALLGILLLVVGAILAFLISLLIQVPIVSYFRYYALLVLGDTNADLDLIAERRAAIRSDGGRDSGRDGGAVGWDDRGDGDGPGPDSTDADRRDDDADEDDWNW